MRTSSLLNPLFPRTRQGLLGIILMHPAAKWHANGLARRLNVTPSTLQRELTSLSDAGILRRQPFANNVFYSANEGHPLYPELRRIFIKTVGLAEVLKESLSPFRDLIEFAFVFGSVADATRSAGSDIDLMVIGGVAAVEMALPLRMAEKELGAEIQLQVYALNEFAQGVRSNGSFLRTVVAGSKIFLKGTEDEFERSVREWKAEKPHSI